jgi:alpha-tubulin suppressor-like RCC1 family protein
LTDGAVYAWGLGQDGQLGDGQAVDSVTQAVQVRFPPGVKIAKLPDDVMPYNEGLAIDTTGHIWGWGTNPFGDALCLDSQTPHPTPVELPLSDVTDAAGALGHALYLSDGRVVACGDNHYGELGDGTTTASSTPVDVQLPPDAVVAHVVAGFHNSGALLADGTYYNWGFNHAGQLGQGNIGGYSDTPVGRATDAGARPAARRPALHEARQQRSDLVRHHRGR